MSQTQAANARALPLLVDENCFGVAVPGIGLDATFATRHPHAGITGMVMQSGGLGLAAMDPRTFARAARRLARAMPVVTVHAGRSRLLEQAGIIAVPGIGEVAADHDVDAIIAIIAARRRGRPGRRHRRAPRRPAAGVPTRGRPVGNHRP